MPLNYEQLEAEMQAGLHDQIGFVVSRTTLAHLIFVTQTFLAHTTALHPGSAEILRAFNRDAIRIGGFPPQTTLLIEQRNHVV